MVDSGKTMSFLAKELGFPVYEAKSVFTVALCNKPANRILTFEPTLTGFRFEADQFLAGYGMDVNGKFRDLPYIGEYLENGEESCLVT